MDRVVIFVFAGRRPNLELQLPMVRRILDEHPNVSYHVWNFTRNASDDAFVRSLDGEPNVVVHNDIGTSVQQSFSFAYRFYSQPEYEGTLFVKIDDDIVFLETERFTAYLAAIKAHSGSVIAAQIINNGACTPLTPALWVKFEELSIALLDVHRSNSYGEISHQYFFDHHAEILGQPIELIPTKDWLSINAIGYDWATACAITADLGKVPHPRFIAGRYFPAPWGIADEGMVNCLPRIIMRGFTACHLTFGPQGCSPEQEDRWRGRYAPIVERYLANAAVADEYELPGLSPLSWIDEHNGRTEESVAAGENDPQVGRLGRGPVLTGPQP